MKRIFALIFTAFLAFCLVPAARAETLDYGRERIYEAVPDDVRESLGEKNITPDNSGALNLTFAQVLSDFWALIKNRAERPLRLFCSLCGVVLFCALAESFTEAGNLKGVFSAVGVLCGAVIATTAIYEILGDTLGTLSSAANFTLVFIPVFTGIAAVLGHAASASAVNAATLAATQLFSQLAVNFLAPLCGTIVGVSVAGASHPQMKLDKLGELVKKFVVWGLTLIMTIFMSVLSMQTLVASAADNTAIKTAKFMVSQGVPIVGGTISDAVNTLQGGLSMLKSSVGTYGIIAAAAIIVPALAGLFCCKLALVCAENLAEMFGLKEMSALYKSCGAALTIIIAVVFCFLLLNTLAAFLTLAITGIV